MDLSRAAILLGAGALAGVMNSIAGGGTIVTFPALLVSGLTSIVANASSTIALLPGTVSSVFGYRRNIPGMRHWLRLFAPVSLAGGFIGGILLANGFPDFLGNYEEASGAFNSTPQALATILRKPRSCPWRVCSRSGMAM